MNLNALSTAWAALPLVDRRLGRVRAGHCGGLLDTFAISRFNPPPQKFSRLARLQQQVKYAGLRHRLALRLRFWSCPTVIAAAAAAAHENATSGHWARGRTIRPGGVRRLRLLAACDPLRHRTTAEDPLPHSALGAACRGCGTSAQSILGAQNSNRLPWERAKRRRAKRRGAKDPAWRAKTRRHFRANRRHCAATGAGGSMNGYVWLGLTYRRWQRGPCHVRSLHRSAPHSEHCAQSQARMLVVAAQAPPSHLPLPAPQPTGSARAAAQSVRARASGWERRRRPTPRTSPI